MCTGRDVAEDSRWCLCCVVVVRDVRHVTIFLNVNAVD